MTAIGFDRATPGVPLGGRHLSAVAALLVVLDAFVVATALTMAKPDRGPATKEAT